MLRAQIAFMAVPVGSGAHVIDLRLRRPLAVAVADAATAGAWLLHPFTAVLCLLGRRWRRDV